MNHNHDHTPSPRRTGLPGWVWLCIIGGGVALVAIVAGFPVGILAALACPLLHLVMGHGGGHQHTTSPTGTSNQPWIRRIEEGESNHG